MGHPDREEGAVQQWEYLEIYVGEGDWGDSSGRRGELESVSVVGHTHDFWNSTPPLNELRAQGWELTGSTGGQFHSWYKLFLKRPKAWQADSEEVPR
jgi:hypothetical protein